MWKWGVFCLRMQCHSNLWCAWDKENNLKYQFFICMHTYKYKSLNYTEFVGGFSSGVFV